MVSGESCAGARVCPENGPAGKLNGSRLEFPWQACQCGSAILERHKIEIARIRVPAKRMRTLDRARAESIAEDILENGQTTPVQVRLDRKDPSGQYILVEGLHRLEALRSLGEATIVAYLVQARVR